MLTIIDYANTVWKFSWKGSSYELKSELCSIMDDTWITSKFNKYSSELKLLAVQKLGSEVHIYAHLKFLLRHDFECLTKDLVDFWKAGRPCCWDCGIFREEQNKDIDWWKDPCCKDCDDKAAFKAEEAFDRWDRQRSSHAGRSDSPCPFCACIPNWDDGDGECNCKREC